MAHSKSRRRKSRSDASSASNQPQPSGGGKRWTPAIVALGAILAAAALLIVLNRSAGPEPESPQVAAFPSPPVQQTSKGYAGPAAFTRTRGNASLSPDGRVTAWAFQDIDLVLSLGIWGGDRPDLTQQISLRGHTAEIRDVAFSGFGQTVASASADHTVKVWDVASGQEMVTLRGHTDEVLAVVFSPDGVSMATAGRDHTIQLWDAYGGLPLTTLSGHTGAVVALAYSADGNLLASASEDKSIKIWDMETGQEIKTLTTGEASQINTLLFSPTQSLLVAMDGRSTLQKWMLPSGEALDRLEMPENEILSIAFSPDGTSLAMAGIDGKIVVTNLTSGSVLADFVAPATPLFIQYTTDGVLRWSQLSVENLTEIGATELVAKIAAASGTAEKAIAGFGIPDDMNMALFADESQVANPAAICADATGRLFVAETFRFDTEVGLGYAGRDIWLLDDLASQTPADRLAMYEKYQEVTAGGMDAHSRYSERIRRLVDTDGDGRADQVTTFADGFNQPLTGTGTGLITRGQDLYYTCIPDLWRLSDRDDDGVADEREAILTGFGVKASLPHGLHGLAWGPDGKLYFSIGDRGYLIKTSDGRTLHNPSTGAVLRCNPDGSDLEEIARGFRNPQELAFDQFGNLFTCDNNSNQGDKARLVYVMPGGDSGWQMSYETMPADYPLGPWNMDKLWETPGSVDAAWVLPPIAHLGIGPAGLAYYPGQGMPERYDGHFFLCDFADAPEVSGVRSFAVQAEGAGFVIQDEHTLISNFLPTDIEFGLDQKIYISDWIRGATSDGLGRIYTGSFPAQISADQVHQTKEWFARGFSTLEVDELVTLLAHADMRVRQQAQFALADRADQAVPPLQRTASDSDNLLARLHAIWALGMVGRNDPSVLEPLIELLADEESEVRSQTAKVLGDVRYAAAADSMVPLLGDDSLRVRAMAAQSLGQIQYVPAIDPILAMLRDNADRDVYLRHAGTFALFQIGDADSIAQYIGDEDRSVRLASLLALRRFSDERLAEFLDDPDETLVVEAARAIYDLPIESALAKLAATVKRSGASEALLRRAINANLLLAKPAQAEALTRFISESDSPDAMKREAISALGQWLQPPPRDRVLGFIRPRQRDPEGSVDDVIAPWITQTMASPEAPLQTEMMTAAAELMIPVGEVGWLSDSRRDLEVRTRLLDQMAERKDARLRQAVDVALQSDAPMLRIHAARLSASLDPSRAIDELSRILVDGTIAEKQAAFQTLGTIASPKVDTLLIDWLKKMQAGQVPAPLKYEIISTANERPSAMVQQELGALIEFLSRQPSLAERYQAVLEGGSADRGRQLFENHTSIQCIRCHMVNNVGGKVGPDLSKIGGKVSREYLLESLLLPEQKIAEGYEGVLVATSDGRVLTGTLKAQTDTELRIVDVDGKELSIAKSEIEQVQGGKSVMPGNLLQQISSSDVRDLIEYLASLK